MATDIVTDQDAAPALEVIPSTTRQPKYTPKDHAATSTLKVVRLMSLDTGEHGKTATFEFTGGFVRCLDVDAQNVWHSVLHPIVGADWRRLLEHVAPRSRCDDGMVLVQRGPMWFWTERMTPRGRVLVTSYFDVPQEDYAHGCLTGARAARDLILFLKAHERAREGGRIMGLEWEIQLCLEEAMRQACANQPSGALGTRAAAHVFSQSVTRFFMVGASNANPAYLDQEVERAQATVAWSLDHDEREREKLMERMSAARAAKVAKRTTTSSQATTPASRAKRMEGAASNGHTLQ